MSKLTVVPFVEDEEAKFNKSEVIRLLEEALGYAKSGKPQSMAVIMINDGEVMTAYHHGGEPFLMVGAIESLKTDYIQAQIERR